MQKYRVLWMAPLPELPSLRDRIGPTGIFFSSRVLVPRLSGETIRLRSRQDMRVHLPLRP